jgi:hypothetical protein
MRLSFLVGLVVACISTVGCGTKTRAPLAPKADSGQRAYSADGDGTVVKVERRYINGSAIPSALRSTWVGDGDNVLVWAKVQYAITKGHPELTTERSFSILYVCDWLRGRMYGPPSPGHCWDDGGDCTPNWGPDPYTANGDPDGTGEALDPDDTGNRAIQFGPPPTKGDPTADDAKSEGDGTIVK